MPTVIRRTSGRMAAGIAASLPVDIRRRIGGRKILRQRRGSASHAKRRLAGLKSGKSFCAMIALSPALVRIKSGSNE
jgi:hypothetical protein